MLHCFHLAFDRLEVSILRSCRFGVGSGVRDVPGASQVNDASSWDMGGFCPGRQVLFFLLRDFDITVQYVRP